MRILWVVFAALVLLLGTLSGPASARRSSGYSSSSRSSSGTTHVKGYYRKDGTYVHPHERRAASSSSSSSYGSSSSAYSVQSAPTRVTTPSYLSSDGLERDSRGRIKRSEAAKYRFVKQTGYPHGRPGYVVDHIVPLARGGADDPSNMQWQTVAEAKAKDKVELGAGHN